MSKLHIPYHETRGHSEDFKVEYTFLSEIEGGRKSIPHQGIRCDFWYECDNHEFEGIFMIHPEFENRFGELIQSGVVEQQGTARMWILSEEMRPYHKERIKLGTIGYFMEGSRRTGKCVVSEIVGLHANPIKFK